MRMEKVAKWPEVSKAWNFDFDDDDDESDGADVASFKRSEKMVRWIIEGTLIDSSRSSQRSRGDNIGFNGDDYGGQRMNNKKGDSGNFRGPKYKGSRFGKIWWQ
ncbi:hypothetical protein LWI28_005627 [Acer negundo]|uniref:Uncharacterized protein n=1 Tax=Acer negundo TaxID=4023 RepID=A0AAD5NUW5_ACENE|nr:hypothetical protein LWI28_005627 [Acer negundo]